MGLFDRAGLPPKEITITNMDVPETIHASGIGDKTALNDRLNDPANWKGTDDDNRWMRWRIYVKHWFAFSSKSKQGVTASFVFFPLMYLFPFTIWFTGWTWWYLFPIAIVPVARKWRYVPTVIVAIKGDGFWRIESSIGQAPIKFKNELLLFPRIETSQVSVMAVFYMSRIQPWCRWHVALHWPLVLTFHFFWRAEDVVPPGQVSDSDGKVISGYRGWHYDADETYWGDGAALGNFK